MRKLIWKELHEQSWKLAFGCIVLSAFVVIGLHARIIPDLSMVSWVCAIGVLILPITSAAGLFPAERAEGSFETLMAMPIPPWKILLAKTMAGIVLCAGPLAAAAVFSAWMAGSRETPIKEMLAICGLSALASVSLLIWMMALSIRLPNEGRAALISMGVLVIWGVVAWPLYENYDYRVLAFTPFGWFIENRFRIGFGEQSFLDGFAATCFAQGVMLLAAWSLARRMLNAPVEDKS
jgi:ABC-type transport system involved in multi-copper enzyme maturation permease subunit